MIPDDDDEWALGELPPPSALSRPCFDEAADGLSIVCLFAAQADEIQVVKQGCGHRFTFRGREIKLVWLQGYIVVVDLPAGVIEVDDGTRLLALDPTAYLDELTILIEHHRSARGGGKHRDHAASPPFLYRSPRASESAQSSGSNVPVEEACKRLQVGTLVSVVCELLPEVEGHNIYINFLVRRLSTNPHYDPNSDALWTLQVVESQSALLSADRRMPPNEQQQQQQQQQVADPPVRQRQQDQQSQQTWWW